VQFTPLLVLGALGLRHVNAIGQHTRPHRRTNVHVERECRGAAMAANLGGHHHVGGVVGAQAAMRFGHAHLEQARVAQVVIVGEGEGGGVVPLGCARGEFVAPQFVGQCQQGTLFGAESHVAHRRGEGKAGVSVHGQAFSAAHVARPGS
jgi:hypothetical protein